MSVTLYFVRHGFAECNSTRVIGNCDSSPLTPEGREQSAFVAGQILSRCTDFSAIFSSPYIRALETCRIFIDYAKNRYALPLEFTVEQRLRERDFSGLNNWILRPESYEELWYFGSSYAKKRGVETLDALERRVEDFLNDIRRDYDGKNVLAFSHGGIGLMFESVIYGSRPESGNLLDYNHFHNGELAIFKL